MLTSNLLESFKTENIFFFEKWQQTKCVCEILTPPIMANSKDGQGHKDKYLDTKILSQEMLMCNMKDLIFIKK